MAKDIKPTEEQISAVVNAMIGNFHLYSEDQPKVILVAGVSGSGKSTCISTLLEKQSMNFFPIQADDYRKFHPKLKEFREKFGNDEAHKKTGNFAHRFATELLYAATEKRFNILYETTFGNIETANTLLAYFKEQNYQIIILALSANVELSILRNQQRYQAKIEAGNTLPRIVEKNVIIRMAENYQACIEQLKQDKSVKLFFVGNEESSADKLKGIVK